MARPKTEALLQEAAGLFIGGVNSPVRAFGSVGGHPVIPHKGLGPTIEDVDGNTYIDYVLSWGPLILGHAHPEIVPQIADAIQRGTSFGMPTEAENRLGNALKRFFPEMERLRLVNSGTEATMSCIRLARGATGREKVIKFVGCYHGHVDALLVEAGSGMATFGIPASPGIPAGLARETLALPFNDTEALRLAFSRYGEQLAGVILETIPCNMGLIFPDPEFLETLQELCRSYETVLIADEVLTGLRAAKGGAYHRYGLEPDLIAAGKVIGGGFPLAAYGGRQDLMNHMAPEGGVYQAGTLSGNPVAATAGAATLEYLWGNDPFAGLEAKSQRIVETVTQAGAEHGINVVAGHVGSIFGVAFRESLPRDFADMQAADQSAYRKFFWGLLNNGIHLAPSAFEVGFLSTAHQEPELARTEEAIQSIFATGLDVDVPS